MTELLEVQTVRLHSPYEPELALGAEKKAIVCQEIQVNKKYPIISFLTYGLLPQISQPFTLKIITDGRMDGQMEGRVLSFHSFLAH